MSSVGSSDFIIVIPLVEILPARLPSDNDNRQPARHPKIPQIRQKPRHRRPHNYWIEISNVRAELVELWNGVNVTIPSTSPPPIPSESLLNYWKRHDLRAAIATHGGREFLAEALEGALIIPGKWKLAVQTPIVQALLVEDSNLSVDNPPLSPQQLVRQVETATKNHTNNETSYRLRRWYHSSSRKPPGYWSSQTKVIEELYQYLEERAKQQKIPQTWMPRLSELTYAGRDDLALALRRFGGPKLICRRAGLIPFREWNYIEGMYELLLELKTYLDQYHGGDYKTFPIALHIQERGYDRLFSLIQYYGGVKFISARLDMDHGWGGKKRRNAMDKTQLLSADMNWGPFDLEFGIELYAFVRNQQLRKKPPLKNPEIRIPSQLILLEYGEQGLGLDRKIQEYGGYENVARRLGLGFSFLSD